MNQSESLTKQVWDDYHLVTMIMESYEQAKADENPLGKLKDNAVYYRKPTVDNYHNAIGGLFSKQVSTLVVCKDKDDAQALRAKVEKQLGHYMSPVHFKTPDDFSDPSKLGNSVRGAQVSILVFHNVTWNQEALDMAAVMATYRPELKLLVFLG